MEKTFFIIKPEVLRDGNLGNIVDRITDAGFVIKEMRKMTASEDLIKKHYNHLLIRPFFNDILQYMTSGPVFVGLLEKENAVEDFRKLLGATLPSKAEKGTIRGDFGYEKITMVYNAVHGSDSKEAVEIESKLWLGQ